MDHPSLPVRVFLLAVEPRKERLDRRAQLGRAVRAAALDQLVREGRLADADGRPRVTGAVHTPVHGSLHGSPPHGPAHDPFVESVLAAVRDSKPRRWKAWVGKDEKKAREAVQAQAVEAGLVRVEPRRLLGVLPHDRVTIRDQRAVNELRSRTARALTGTEPVNRLEPELLTLTVIAALARFGSVSDGRTRRRQRQRIKRLVEQGGPALLALKKSLDDQESSSSGAAG